MADHQVRAFEGGVAKAVGERQIRVTITSPRVDRHGDIVELAGVDTAEYLRNPVVLWQHDHDEPIARCVELNVGTGRIDALVQFPPSGTSRTSDEAYSLVKAGVVSAASIGFIPKEWSYLDDKSPWEGVRYRSVDLIEFSFVSVPANPDALVIERGAIAKNVGAQMVGQLELAVAGIKAGRVLSRGNEEKLRAAHASIGEVLALVGEAPEAAMRTLYVKRPVLNGPEIQAWAQACGFASTLPPAEMHVTLAFSRLKLDWSALTPAEDEMTIAGGARSVMPLGDKGAVVLRIESDALAQRWAEIKAAGASWDHDGYKPHVTLTYAGGDIDLTGLEAFVGDIILGGEIFQEVQEDWQAGIREEAARQRAARLRAVAARLRITGLTA